MSVTSLASVNKVTTVFQCIPCYGFTQVQGHVLNLSASES